NAELRDQIEECIKVLDQRQTYMGGFASWPTQGPGLYTAREYPFTSVHAVHALLRARNAGFKVSAATIDRAHKHLLSIVSDVGKDAKPTSQAYAAYVCSLLGDRQDHAIARLASLPDKKLDVEAQCWLL